MKKNFFVLISLLTCLPLWAYEGHEHASNAPTAVKWGLAGLEQLPNIHPVIVHFPIALLLAALLFYALGLLLKKEEFFFGGKWLLYFGTIAAAAAVWTGLRAANGITHDEESHMIMMPHQYLGIAILISSGLLSAWVFLSKANIPVRRWLFLMSLLLIAAMIFQQADFGGRLVFQKGVGVSDKKTATEIEPAQSSSHADHSH